MRSILRIVLLTMLVLALSACGSKQLGVDKPLVIMPMGDSITEGTCDSQENCDMSVEHPLTEGGYVPACYLSYGESNPNAVGYRAFLIDDLAAAGLEMNYTGSVNIPEGLAHEAHFDFSIADLDFCVQNADWFEKTVPDIILLHTGSYDAAYANNAPEQMAANLKALIEHIYATVPEKTYVLVAQILPFASDIKISFGASAGKLVNEFIEPYNELIPGVVEELHAAGKNVYVVDLRSAIQSDADFAADGGHPLAATHERVAKIWSDKIIELLKTE